jgi:ribonuclease VapC
MTQVVLDASALLAVLREEPGGDLVAPIISTSIMTAINFSEVVGALIFRGATGEQADAMLAPFDVEVIPSDKTLAVSAGRLRSITARAGLSLGDRFCLALAIREGLEAWTADRRWADIADATGAKVRLIR